MTPVRLEPTALRSGVKYSTTEASAIVNGIFTICILSAIVNGVAMKSDQLFVVL